MHPEKLSPSLRQKIGKSLIYPGDSRKRTVALYSQSSKLKKAVGHSEIFSLYGQQMIYKLHWLPLNIWKIVVKISNNFLCDTEKQEVTNVLFNCPFCQIQSSSILLLTIKMKKLEIVIEKCLYSKETIVCPWRNLLRYSWTIFSISAVSFYILPVCWAPHNPTCV